MLNHTHVRARTLRSAAVRVLLLTGLLIFAAADTVRAEPPCWAPAHGYRAKHGGGDCDKSYRKKHKGKHREKRGGGDNYHYEAPRHGDTSAGGISAGGLVGAAVGGYAGSKVGKGKGNLAATAAGAVGGYIVGQEVERQLSEPQR